MIRRLWGIGLILGLNLAMLAAALEGYARITQGEVLRSVANELGFREADDRRHHRMIPHATGRSITREWNVAYQVNALGLRDREYAVPKPAGVVRILVVGDSFVEGFGVELSESAVKGLECRLNAARGERGARFEVVNGGTAGYSPLLEYLFLAQDGLALEPDLAVLLYNFGDLSDDEEYERTAQFDADGRPIACTPPADAEFTHRNPVQQFLRRHSLGYLYLERRIEKFLRKRQAPTQAPFNREAMIAFRGPEPVIAELWQRNARYLGLIDGLLRARGIPWLLVTYPDALEIGPEEWACGRKAHGFAEGVVYPQPSVVARLGEFAASHAVPLINLYDWFRASETRPLYFSCDGHFNAAGQARLAEGLFRELKPVIMGRFSDENPDASARVE